MSRSDIDLGRRGHHLAPGALRDLSYRPGPTPPRVCGKMMQVYLQVRALLFTQPGAQRKEGYTFGIHLGSDRQVVLVMVCKFPAMLCNGRV